MYCNCQSIGDVRASDDAIIDPFEIMESCLQRLDISTKIQPMPAMAEIFMKILIEVLSTLALQT